MITIKFEPDRDALVYALGEHKKKARTIERRIMGKLLAATKKDVQKNKLRGQVLHSGPGQAQRWNAESGQFEPRKRLYSSITFKTKSDGTGYIRSNSFVSLFHEAGPVTITPKNGKVLKLFFPRSGEWRTMKSVTLPRRQFLFPSLDDFFNKGKGKDIADSVLQDSLDKIYKKAAAK